LFVVGLVLWLEDYVIVCVVVVMVWVFGLVVVVEGIEIVE